MNNAPRRKRSQRVTSLEVRPGALLRGLSLLREQRVLVRVGLTLVGMLLLWAVTVPWHPPFPHRTFDVPPRDMLATVSFTVEDPKATQDARLEAAKQVRFVYAHDPEPLTKLRAELGQTLKQVATAKSRPAWWKDFLPPHELPWPTESEQDAQFQQFQKILNGEGGLERLEFAVADALQRYEKTDGLLAELPPPSEPGRRDEIAIHPVGNPAIRHAVKPSDVLIGQGKELHERLSAEVESIGAADRVFFWLLPRLRPTLKYNAEQTRIEKKAASDAVPVERDAYTAGQTLAKGGEPLGAQQWNLLRHEHEMAIHEMSTAQMAGRALASLGMIFALYVMCGYYVYFREPRLIESIPRLLVMLTMAVATVALARWFSLDTWRAELIPLVLFAMTVAIAYRQDLALLVSVSLAMVIVFDLGQSLGHLIVMVGVAATAVFMLSEVRSRSKLITVGFCAGLVAFGLSLGAGLLEGRPIGSMAQLELLLWAGGRNAAWTLVAGFLISGLLPFIESRFRVVTDISLLELGDVSHPLLQELVRRAPGTYNHSITMASMADAAAEAIGANGLLVRVGAYFHDIGKMLKPGYFIENQGQETNRHESLVPAMSALIIIAHVKDGADLARQHHLPEPIIDFIEQHHGTTLVEYFYHRASRQQEGDPFAAEILESDFRYPGPKPQTKESGVMMIADAVESASRVLAEPTPTRIRNLVHEITMKRLLDGQFDECGLNLRELRVIEDSLVKSLIAVYHSRVRYPDQKSA